MPGTMYIPEGMGLSREKLVSFSASVLINLAIVGAFAGLARGTVRDSGEGEALTVVSLGGTVSADGEVSEAEAETSPPPAATVEPEGAAESKPAPAVLITRPQRVSEEVGERHPAVPQVAPEVVAANVPAVETPIVAASAPPAKPSAALADRPGERGEAESQVAMKDGDGGSGGYATEVRRHLMRYRRQNTSGAGSAFIRFTVEPDGRCHGIGIARSSGSTRFDHAAMQMVRRAVPFPRPPGGSSRSFNFEITGT
jgi:periplasmic protein TonB